MATDSTPAAWLPISIIAVAWWMLTRPYQGIWHDGIFYAAQALRRLQPESYAQDIFFQFGSQDDFTLYSVLQAWLTQLLGMEHAALFLTLAGAALWLYALLRLLGRWFLNATLVASIILVLTADSHYGGFDVFSYGEHFASPRVFSEALVLLSLACWLEGRRVAAGLLVITAALLHPLIAMAGMGLLVWSGLYARSTRPAVLWLTLLIMGLLGMQLLVWSGLSPRLDPLWRELVAQRSPFVFISLWEFSDWLLVAQDAMLLWLASRYLEAGSGRLAGWLLPVLALGLLLALAAEAMGVQLAVAAQLYRVQWLAHLGALALAMPLCLHLWRSSSAWDRYLAAGVGVSLLFPLNLGGLALPVMYGLYRWSASRFPDQPRPGGVRLLLSGIPLAGLALWLFYLPTDLMLADELGHRHGWLPLFIQIPVALGLFYAGYAMSKRLKQKQAWLWIYGICMLAGGMMFWNISRPWNELYEQPLRTAAIAPVKALIPKDAIVYWESGAYLTPDNRAELDEGFERSWFWLRRSNYVSFDQAAGNVFHRKTAVEIARRAAHLRQWGYRDGNLDWNERKKLPVKHPMSLARLQGICSDTVLDFVITDSKLPWALLSFEDPLNGRQFSVYACAVRQAG